MQVNIALLTVTDTRTIDTDKSGAILVKKIKEQNHKLIDRKIVKDEKEEIKKIILEWLKNKDLDAIITTGGTGLTGRDITPEAIKDVTDKEIPGFGGGSTYLALLLIWGIPYFVFPVIALSCNIIVVSGNCFNYIRAGNLNLKLLIPYLIGSVPLAFIGGSLTIEKTLFEIFLFIVLAVAGTLLLFNFKSYDDKEESYKKIPTVVAIIIGSILGFVSGIVGIGGGIFLSPILFLIKAGRPKHIVTAASLFILINSVSGIIGQLTKSEVLNEISNYWYLLAAVFIGGQLGNFLNLKIFPTRILALLTAVLVLFVSIRIGLKIF